MGKTLVSFLISISSTLAPLVSATSHRLYDIIFKLQRCTVQALISRMRKQSSEMTAESHTALERPMLGSLLGVL